MRLPIISRAVLRKRHFVHQPCALPNSLRPSPPARVSPLRVNRSNSSQLHTLPTAGGATPKERLGQVVVVRDTTICGVIVVLGSFVCTTFLDWYEDLPLESSERPVTIANFFKDSPRYEGLQDKLKRPFGDETNVIVVQGPHGTGKTVSMGQSYLDTHDWYGIAVPWQQRYFGYGRKGPWLKCWFTVGKLKDCDRVSIEKRMRKVADVVQKQTWARLYAHSYTAGGILWGLSWLPESFEDYFRPLIIDQSDDDQTLANLKSYLEAHPGWLFVFDDVESYEVIESYLPRKGGVVMISTNNPVLMHGGANISWLEFSKLKEGDECAAFINHFFNDRQESSEQLEKLAHAMDYLPQGIAFAACYTKEAGISVGKFLEELSEFPLATLDQESEFVGQHLNLIKTLELDLKHLKLSETKNMSFWQRQYQTYVAHPVPAIRILNFLALLAPGHPVPVSFVVSLLDDLAAPRIHKAIKTLTKLSLIERVDDDYVVLQPLTHRILHAMIPSRELDNPKYPRLHQFRQWVYFRPTALDLLLSKLIDYFDGRATSDFDEFADILSHFFYLHSQFSEISEASSTRYQKDLYISLLQVLLDLHDEAKFTMDYDEYQQLFASADEIKSLAYQKALLEKILAYQEENDGSDDLSLVDALVKLGHLHWQLGEVLDAKMVFDRLLRIQEKHYASDHHKVASTMVDLGNVLSRLGEIAQAKALYEEALRIQERHYGSDHHKVALTLVNLGAAHFQLGEISEAKALYERALPIQEEHYGPDHHKVASTMINLGNALLHLGVISEAKALYDQALCIQEQHFGPDHPKVALTLLNLANYHIQLGEVSKAKGLYERALRIQEEHFKSDHDELALTLFSLGNAHFRLGEVSKAKGLYERALHIQEQHYGSDHREVARTLLSLANAHIELGEVPEAKALYERALPIYESHYGVSHRITVLLRRRIEQLNVQAPRVSVANLPTSFFAKNDPEGMKGSDPIEARP